MRTGLHVCRGNWSRQEDVLLTGDYHALLPAFRAMKVDQFVLEYATPRAGELRIVGEALGRPGARPRLRQPAHRRGRGSRRRSWPGPRRRSATSRPEQIFLNPDCGFGCFANRCVNDEAIAVAKLRCMVAAARELRERHG